MNYSLIIENHQFELHPTGALFWPGKKTLLISDVHLGKVTHFRKFGAAVPPSLIRKNFELLDSVMDEFMPSHLYFLGDLFHSYLNNEWQLFENWVAGKSEDITLVTGNHDIISPLKYESIGIVSTEEYVVENFYFTHEPSRKTGMFNISGHIHPAVRLKGKGRQSIKLPCFFKSQDQMILPAFGKFTGTHVLPVKNGNEVFACTKTEVLKI
ncbi:MAG: ligase-associated DNA damage response endonuclease PdeM [Flavobacteriaceae bacterium]